MLLSRVGWCALLPERQKEKEQKTAGLIQGAHASPSTMQAQQPAASAGGYQQQQETDLVFFTELTVPCSSASLGSTDTSVSSRLRPVPPSTSPPKKHRPSHHRLRLQEKGELEQSGATGGEVCSADQPLAHNPIPETRSSSSDTLTDLSLSSSALAGLPLRVRARHRDRFFGPAMTWAHQQERLRNQPVDLSNLPYVQELVAAYNDSDDDDSVGDDLLHSDSDSDNELARGSISSASRRDAF